MYRAMVTGVLGLAVWACAGSRSAMEARHGGQASSREACAPVDSGHGGGVPVYRECGVDQPARIRGEPARMEFNPTSGRQSCYRAVIEMVVDENGEPVTGTARIVQANNSEFGLAALHSALATRYHPARKGGMAVRQVVSVGRAAVAQVRSSTELTPPRRPRVNC